MRDITDMSEGGEDRDDARTEYRTKSERTESARKEGERTTSTRTERSL